MNEGIDTVVNSVFCFTTVAKHNVDLYSLEQAEVANTVDGLPAINTNTILY